MVVKHLIARMNKYLGDREFAILEGIGSHLESTDIPGFLAPLIELAIFGSSADDRKLVSFLGNERQGMLACHLQAAAEFLKEAGPPAEDLLAIFGYQRPPNVGNR